MGAFRQLFVFIALSPLIGCMNEVPVLMWGTGSTLLHFDVPALKKLGTTEFYENFLKKLTEYNPSVIGLFIEETLSVEDLRSINVKGDAAYPLVQRIVETDNFGKYIPAVEDPMKAFSMLKKEDYNLCFDNKTAEPDTKNIFIYLLSDARDYENRVELLRRHDELIDEKCNQLMRKYDTVVCVLTAYGSSWVEPQTNQMRKLLATDEEEDEKPSTWVLFKCDTLGMVFTRTAPLLVNLNDNTTNELILNKNVPSTKQRKVCNTKVFLDKNTTDIVQMEYSFSSNNRTWQLEKINLIINKNASRAELNATTYLGASVGYSYHVPKKVVFENENYQILFDTMQVEYFNGIDRSSFSVADDTVYFFTVPILSGLLISFFLLWIMMIGVSMIMDIKTMDQFDDPKGKLLSINALE